MYMSVASIQIPEPCHQDWGSMKAKSHGRHCDSCQKIVVDFTTWEAGDILRYLQKHSNTCGRFKKSQIVATVPAPKVERIRQSLIPIFRAPVAMVTRIAAFVLLSFYVVSCGESPVQAQGIVQAPNDTDIVTGGAVSLDSSGIQNLHRPDSGIRLSEPLPVNDIGIVPVLPPAPLVEPVTMGVPVMPPKPPVCPPAPVPDEEIMGDVVYMPNPADTLSPEIIEEKSKQIELPTDKRSLSVPRETKH